MVGILHYAQNCLWKKLKPAGMRPWFLNYAMFSDAESVVFKILTLAKGFFIQLFRFGLIDQFSRVLDGSISCSRGSVCCWKKFCCKSKWMKIYWRRPQLSFDISNIDIWSLVTLIIKQICKQTVLISVFWALEAFFVAEKNFAVNQNDKKNIEEASSFHLTHQNSISDHWWM